jgi:predicted aspartyl protease
MTRAASSFTFRAARRTDFPSCVSSGARVGCLAVLICSLSAFCFGGDISMRTVSPPRAIAEIPFKPYQTYLIVVEGRLGTLEHQRLLLDTGSNPSMIDQSVSAKLGLKGTARGLSLFNKSVASESVTLPSLQFGPMQRQDLPVMVADFSAVGRGLGTRIDAVIGLDVLGGTNFTIDYSKRKIFFGALPEPHTAPFITVRQLITVNLKNGGRPLHLLVDTGTPELVLFEDHLHGVEYVWSTATGNGRNVSGDVHFGIVVLTQSKIGTHDMGPQRASVVASRKEIANDLDGLMGLSCLRARRITFDFERQLLGWSE